MKRTAFIHHGAHPHLACLKDPALRAMDLVDMYAPEFTAADLEQVDSVYLAARLHPMMLQKVTPALVDFIKRPGTKMYVDGENSVGSWLPGTTQTPRGTNFWAWRIGEDVGRRSVNTDHVFWENLAHDALHWHYHGVLTHPEHAVPLVRLESLEEQDNPKDPWGTHYRALPEHPNTLMYYDEHSFAGDLVVSTMDAAYHHGSGFMPGASQLMYRMLYWLRS